MILAHRKSCIYFVDTDSGCSFGATCGFPCITYKRKNNGRYKTPCRFLKSYIDHCTMTRYSACVKGRFKVISSCPKRCKRRYE